MCVFCDLQMSTAGLGTGTDLVSCAAGWQVEPNDMSQLEEGLAVDPD